MNSLLPDSEDVYGLCSEQNKLIVKHDDGLVAGPLTRVRQRLANITTRSQRLVETSAVS